MYFPTVLDSASKIISFGSVNGNGSNPDPRDNLHQRHASAHRVAHSPSVPTKPAAETEDAEALTTETIATRSTCSARVPAALRLGSVQ
jgi:hypothetical protein